MRTLVHFVVVDGRRFWRVRCHTRTIVIVLKVIVTRGRSACSRILEAQRADAVEVIEALPTVETIAGLGLTLAEGDVFSQTTHQTLGWFAAATVDLLSAILRFSHRRHSTAREDSSGVRLTRMIVGPDGVMQDARQSGALSRDDTVQVTES